MLLDDVLVLVTSATAVAGTFTFMRPLTALLIVIVGLAAASPAVAAPLHVLVTNDDGVRAEGIDAIVRALQSEPDVRVSVVAPATNQSGRGGLTTRGPVRWLPATTRSGVPAVAVRGTPADSVNVALREVLPADRPDLVVSGINDGNNIGVVRNGSGTVGAARRAANSGLPALATSQGSGRPTRYDDGVAATIAWVRGNRDRLVPGTVHNLNTPSCRFGASALGLLHVPATDVLDRDTLRVFLGAPVICRATGVRPRDEVRAYLQGYAAVSPIRP
jgi:5'-nucleotidase